MKIANEKYVQVVTDGYYRRRTMFSRNISLTLTCNQTQINIWIQTSNYASVTNTIQKCINIMASRPIAHIRD